MKEFLCPTCINASHDYCFTRHVSEAQTECAFYDDGKKKKRLAVVEINRCSLCPDVVWQSIKHRRSAAHKFQYCGINKQAVNGKNIPAHCPKLKED